MPTEPIPFRALRYRCPHCPRTGSSKARITEHIGRCWTNPDARGCKTCRHFRVDIDHGESCQVGVDLSGRPECEACHGTGQVFDRGTLGASECPDCGGDAAEIKRGPIVHCDRWELDR